MKVAVIGLWHQGIVGAACLADLGFDVTAGDFNKARIDNLSRGFAPLFEPELDELLARGIASERLRFTSDVAAAVVDCPLIFWMFDTSVNEADESDLTELFDAARAIAATVAPGAILLSSAQAPIGTMDRILSTMREMNPALDCTVAYTPENLRLGEAVARFRHPCLAVLGSDSAATLDRLAEILTVLSARWHRVSLRTAEMIKHALNAYLAISLTFANELGNLCDEVGADGKAVGELLRLDPRIGVKAMLSPGLGFAGGTLARDVQTLRSLGDSVGTATPLLDGLWASNQAQNQLVMRVLTARLGNLQGKIVTFLGLTYKPETSTLRRSAAIEIANDVLAKGASVIGHDPKADDSELASLSNLKRMADPYEAATGSDALVLMTPWHEYRSINFMRLRNAMRQPFVLDTAGMWDHEAVEANGIVHWDIGRGRSAGAGRKGS
jgi:UDPglucose 6-dehydrogenase